MTLKFELVQHKSFNFDLDYNPGKAINLLNYKK